MTEVKKPKFTLVEILLILVLATLLFYCSFFHPVIDAHPEKGRRIKCLHNLEQIGVALNLYYQDYKQYPPYDGAQSLKLLYLKGYLKDLEFMICPSTKKTIKSIDDITDDNCSYIYKEGLKKDDLYNAEMGICWDKPENHSKYGNVLLIDGHVTGFVGANWTKHLNSFDSSNFTCGDLIQREIENTDSVTIIIANSGMLQVLTKSPIDLSKLDKGAYTCLGAKGWEESEIPFFVIDQSKDKIRISQIIESLAVKEKYSPICQCLGEVLIQFHTPSLKNLYIKIHDRKVGHVIFDGWNDKPQSSNMSDTLLTQSAKEKLSDILNGYNVDDFIRKLDTTSSNNSTILNIKKYPQPQTHSEPMTGN